MLGGGTTLNRPRPLFKGADDEGRRLRGNERRSLYGGFPKFGIPFWVPD